LSDLAATSENEHLNTDNNQARNSRTDITSLRKVSPRLT